MIQTVHAKETGKRVAQNQATHRTCKFTLASRQAELVRRTKNLTLLDTVKKNKLELPRELLLLQGRVVNSSRYAFSED
ncbi:hypothetical protein T08_370 [Trichinella sp. T8]|nr:hypothetical protein T08_370 [Trichinella sp. T8]